MREVILLHFTLIWSPRSNPACAPLAQEAAPTPCAVTPLAISELLRQHLPAHLRVHAGLASCVEALAASSSWPLRPGTGLPEEVHGQSWLG